MNRKLWMNPQEAAVSLGISVKTLRRWDKAGKLHVARTAGNHRRIGMAEIQRLQRQGEQAVRCALYARVSTGLQAQEGNLARQLERLRVAAAEREDQVVQTIAAYASSLNEKRRGMKKQLELLEQQAVDVVLIDYPDRLVRFGFSSLQETFRWQQVRLEVLDPPAQVDPTTDLLADLLTIVTVFSEKRAALEKTTAILTEARAFFLDFLLAHHEKLTEKVVYFSEQHQEWRERLLTAEELRSWLEQCTVSTKAHPSVPPEWDFKARFPGMPTHARRATMKEAIGKARG